jgi:sister-chromatid-cohesion protein PDS5
LQYFSEVIVTASSEEGQVEREKGLRTAHGLVIQINRAVPALLLNVVPALEEELRTEDLMVRQIATKTLGQMFAEKTGSDLARKYSSTWREWLGRANDRHTTIRISWAEAAGPLLTVLRPEQREELNQVVFAKLGDPDDKVRAAMVHTLGTLDYETALHHVEKRVWEETAVRCKDRKAGVRAQAFDTLGRVYKLARGELISRDPKATSQFSWIPREVLKAIYCKDPDIMQHVAAALDRHFLRLTVGASEDEWAGRLLLVMSQLDDSARKALLRLTNLQKARTKFVAFVQACEAYNGGIIDHDEDLVKRKLTDSINQMASQLADAQKTKVDLYAFAKMNDNRAYKLLRMCFDEATDLKGLIKARTDVLQRIRDKDAGVADTMEHLLRAACLFIVNRSTIPTLIRKLQDSKDVGDVGMTPAGDVGDETQGTILATSAREAELSAARRDSEFLLRAVAKNCPKILTSHVPELVKALSADSNHTLAKESLRALAAVALNEPAAMPVERKAIERFSRYVRLGTMHEAKYAGRLISVLSKGKKAGATALDARGAQLAHTAAEQLAEELTKRLPTSSGERLVADLAALGQIVKHAPEAAADVGDAIVRHLLTGILQKPWPADETVAAEEEDDAPSWVEDDDMSTSLRSKLLSLDLLTKRCMAYASADGVTDVAVPVFRLLFATLTSGEPRPLGASPASKSRMRLQAGICILKMARVDKLEQCIKHEFVSLALMVQDECSNVRTLFLYKLLLFLRKRVLPPRFNAAPFLAAYDPDEENRQMVVNYAQSMYRNMPGEWRMKLFELPFTRFLHLLAHHPDFGRDSVEELSDSGKYIDFYLDALANAENVGLLYHLATKLKGVRDVETSAHSDNLYTLSELAQLYIRLRAASQNWTIQTYPGKTRLPTDIFRPLPSREVQKEVSWSAPSSATQADARSSRRCTSASSFQRRPFWR